METMKRAEEILRIKYTIAGRFILPVRSKEYDEAFAHCLQLAEREERINALPDWYKDRLISGLKTSLENTKYLSSGYIQKRREILNQIWELEGTFIYG